MTTPEDRPVLARRSRRDPRIGDGYWLHGGDGVEFVARRVAGGWSLHIDGRPGTACTFPRLRDCAEFVGAWHGRG